MRQFIKNGDREPCRILNSVAFILCLSSIQLREFLITLFKSTTSELKSVRSLELSS